VQVLTAKSDVDGALEAQLAFLTRGGHRLFYLNEEAPEYRVGPLGPGQCPDHALLEHL